MMNNSFTVYINREQIGNSLSLQVLNKNTTYREWAVEDAFNGITRSVKVNSKIYGFFLSGNYVNLHLIETDGTSHIIKNVQLEDLNVMKGGF